MIKRGSDVCRHSSSDSPKYRKSNGNAGLPSLTPDFKGALKILLLSKMLSYLPLKQPAAMTGELIRAWGRVTKPQAGWCEVWVMWKCHLEATAVITKLTKSREPLPADRLFLFLRSPGTAVSGAEAGNLPEAGARPHRGLASHPASGQVCSCPGSSAGWLLPSVQRRPWCSWENEHSQLTRHWGHSLAWVCLTTKAAASQYSTMPSYQGLSSPLFINPLLIMVQLLSWLLQCFICYLLEPTRQQSWSFWGGKGWLQAFTALSHLSALPRFIPQPWTIQELLSANIWAPSLVDRDGGSRG